MSRAWLVDAALSGDVLTFVRFDDVTGEIVFGLTMVGGIPEGDTLIGVCHPDGDAAATAWLEGNRERLAAYIRA